MYASRLPVRQVRQSLGLQLRECRAPRAVAACTTRSLAMQNHKWAEHAQKVVQRPVATLSELLRRGMELEVVRRGVEVEIDLGARHAPIELRASLVAERVALVPAMRRESAPAPAPAPDAAPP
jgi:hypothetical protein